VNVANLWAIGLAGAALAIPVLVHLLTRPRPQRFPLSTVRFVREVVQQKRSRNRLRDIIILALRTLALAMIGLAIARPMWGDRPLVEPEGEGDIARVVLVDVSQSMAARQQGIALFERARAIASKYLVARSGLRINLILAGATPHAAFEGPSINVTVLRDNLAQAEPRAERLQLDAALKLAAPMLAQGGEATRRELVIVSDFQRTAWSNVDFGLLPEGTEIQLESVAPAEPLDNCAVLAVECQGRPTAGQSLKANVEVGNFGPAARQIEVEVQLGDDAFRIAGLCPPGVATILSGETTLRESGWRTGSARLLDLDDALASDNRRPFVLSVRDAARYVLVTSQPVSRRPSAAYYLERALSPYESRGDGRTTAIDRVSPARLDLETVGDADLIVLDHPGPLNEPVVKLLASLLRRGRPIFYVAGQLIDAVNLRRLSDELGADLQTPVELAPPARGMLRRDMTIAEVNRRAAPFQTFGDQLSSHLEGLRFNGALSSRRLEGGLADEVLATYSDRSACLFISRAGAGRLAVLNADLEQTNLPTSQMFVPLLSELVDELIQRDVNPTALAGEPMLRRMPLHLKPQQNLEVVSDSKSQGGATAEPDDSAADARGAFSSESDGVVWSWNSPGPVGAYRVVTQDERRQDQTVYAQAVATAAEESDLAAIGSDVLTERLAVKGRNLHYHISTAENLDDSDLWAWLAAAAVLCLLGEIVALRMFRT
jgi:hypothetical protein